MTKIKRDGCKPPSPYELQESLSKLITIVRLLNFKNRRNLIH